MNVDYSNFFKIMLDTFDMLVRWGAQLWNLLTYDFHDSISSIPAGTTLLLILPVIGAAVIIIKLLVKLLT